MTTDVQDYLYAEGIASIEIEGVKNTFIQVNKFKVVDGIEIKNFTLVEGFCKLYDLELTLSYQTKNIDYNILQQKSLVSKKVTFHMGTSVFVQNEMKKDVRIFLPRVISGIITDSSLKHTYENAPVNFTNSVTLRIKPNIYLMDLKKKNFIFKDVPILKIIQTVLERNKIEKATIEIENNDVKTKKIPFVTQYQESDFAFLTRILQEYRLHFYIHYDKKGIEHLNIGEGKKNIQADRTDSFFATNYFLAFKEVDQISYPISQEGMNTKNTKNQLVLPIEKAHLMKSYLRKMVYPGKKIELIDLYKKDSKTSMFVLGSKTTGVKNEETNNLNVSHEIDYYNFEAGIAAMAKINKPKIHSSQYALVVGKKGQDSSATKDGCVSVNLFWGEQKENKYPVLETPIEIPVGQIFGGKSGENGFCGAWFMPRVGQKVIVHFLEGDPNQPIIVGNAYDNKNISPYHGQAEIPITTQFGIKTCSTPNQKDAKKKKGHEFLFIDELNKEKIVLNSTKDLDLVSGANTLLAVTENFKTTLTKGNNIVEITEGNNLVTLKKGNSQVTLTQGNYNLKIDRGDCIITVTGNIKFKATGGNINFTADKDITLEGTNIALKAHANLKLEAMKTSSKSNGPCEIAGATLNLQGQATATLKAAQVTVKGDAQGTLDAPMVEVKGGAMATIKGGALINMQ